MSGSSKCIVCSHISKLQINRAIASGRTLASISREYGVPEDSVRVHRDKHLSHQLVTAFRKKTEIESMDIFSNIDDLITRTKKILTEAESKNKHELALKAIAEARNSYELLCKIAVAYHQTRAEELAMDRASIEQEIQEQNQQAVSEGLDVLTPEEQDLYFQLNMKILNRDANMIIEYTKKTDFKAHSEVLAYKDTTEEEIVDCSQEKQCTTQDIDPLIDETLRVRPVLPRKIVTEDVNNPSTLIREYSERQKQMDNPDVMKKIRIIRNR